MAMRLDGATIWEFQAKVHEVKCYCLIPITYDEVQFKIHEGIESLESRFEDQQSNHLDPNRPTMA
jgi:hypothetical protein